MASGPADETIVELLVQAERTAARIAGRGPAEDIASEAVTRALVRWSRVADHPHAWVTRVATNLAIDALRRAPRPGTESRSAAQPSFESETVRRLDVVRGLGRLPRRQRQVVVLHYLAGFTDAQVSETLGLSVPTVKTHLGRALTTLRSLTSAFMEESDASPDPA